MPSQRAYRLIVLILVLISVLTLTLVATVLISTRPPSAAPLTTHTATPVFTPIPTLAGVSPELLLCQRQAGQAMHARQMVGAVNLADDRQITFRWVSQDWPISDLNSALAGVISSLDVALEVWQEGCTVYDRVRIEVYDREQEAQALRLTVTASMGDVLGWRTGEIDDATLIARLQVERARPVQE